jgi:all-trans-retinol 13,14-reductase
MNQIYNKSVVVIGGGIGGLFSGAILAKEGLKVTVLEQNATVGGGLQSFTRFGEVFDTGMHMIGGMQKGGSTRKLCEYLGIFDKIEVKDVDRDTIDHIYFAEDKKIYKTAQGKVNFVNAMSEHFPAEKENLIAYIEALYKIANESDLLYLRPTNSNSILPKFSEEASISVNDFIAKYITNKRLRKVLAYLSPFYGGVKDTTPAYIHALISVLYINGPSRFAGGSYLLAETLKEYIIKLGGEVIVSDGVKHVSSKDRNITSVVTNKGKVYTADYYICAIHPCTFITLLDDPTIFPKAYRNRLNQIPNTYSAFTVYFKFKKDSFKYINHTSYYVGKYDDVWEFSNPNHKWPIGFIYTTPPEINQGEYSTKMIIVAPMLWEETKKWENTTVGKRGEEYKRWKEENVEKIIEKLTEIYPKFRDCIENVNAASPLTIRDYYGVKEGSMYGYLKDCNNMTLSGIPVVTKVKNLFLTGQNCGIHGFCGVTLTCINTCEAILGHNYILNRINKL